MDGTQTLQRLVRALELAEVPYMVVGSFASTLHGLPRTTQDIDVVVSLDADKLDALLTALPEEDWYRSEVAARDGLRFGSMFNVIEVATGWKVDLIPLKSEAFAHEEFSRRETLDLLGVRASVATAEDTILAKLRWARDSGGSERQVRDVVGIVRSVGEDLDTEYVDRWVDRLGLRDLWARAQWLSNDEA